MSNGNFTILSDRSLIRISGQDSVSFLQGLISNDVTKVSDTRSIYAAFLTPQGKYLYDFFVFSYRNCIYLDCEAARINDFRKRLEMYRLRSKVEIEVVSSFNIIALFGEKAANSIGLAEKLGETATFYKGLAFIDPRLTIAGARCILPDDQMGKVTELDLLQKDLDVYLRHCIIHGLPNGSKDMTIDKSTLLECGFEELNGVDFSKGCYMGQELTARTKYRGLIKRRLVPVLLEGPQLASGSKITQETKVVGEIRSVAGNWAMSLIRLEAFSVPSVLNVNDTKVTLKKPVWMQI